MSLAPSMSGGTILERAIDGAAVTLSRLRMWITTDPSKEQGGAFTPTLCVQERERIALPE